QAAINAGSNLVPQDLPAPPVYSKVNPADAPIITLGLSSRTMSLPDIQNLADTRLAQKLSQVPGVGLVTLSGGQRPAVRVQANPKAPAPAGPGLGARRRSASPRGRSPPRPPTEMKEKRGPAGGGGAAPIRSTPTTSCAPPPNTAA